jgi:hypothetical protein
MSFVKHVLSASLIMVMAACGGGGGSAGTSSGSAVVVEALKVAAPSELTVAPGVAASYSVTGGQAPYSAVSDNSTITQVAISADNKLVVGGVIVGTSKVQVRDAKSTMVELTVTVSAGPAVPLFTTAPNPLNMAPATNQTFRVLGGKAPYVIASDKLSVATVTPDGTSFKIDAIAIGVANLKITDSLGASVNVAVNVVSSGVPLSVSPTTAQVYVDMTVELLVVGGSPPYRVAGGIPSAFRVAADPINANKFLVTPLLVSSGLDINILDSQDASVKFTLTAIAGQPTIRMSPAALTVSERDSNTISLTVFGAAGTVNAFSSDLGLLTTEVSRVNNANVITVTRRACVALDTPVTITVVDANRAVAISVITVKDNGNIAAVAATLTAPAVVASNCPS